MQESRKHILALIERLEQSLGNEVKEAVIFGSAAIVLHDVDLGRRVRDLDVFVSECTFNNLGSRFKVKEKIKAEGGTIAYIKPVDNADIEIFTSFPGVSFSEVSESACTLDGKTVRYGSLDHLRQWKMAQGREKDRQDLEAIERSMRAKQKSCAANDRQGGSGSKT